LRENVRTKMSFLPKKKRPET